MKVLCSCISLFQLYSLILGYIFSCSLFTFCVFAIFYKCFKGRYKVKYQNDSYLLITILSCSIQPIEHSKCSINTLLSREPSAYKYPLYSESIVLGTRRQ